MTIVHVGGQRTDRLILFPFGRDARANHNCYRSSGNKKKKAPATPLGRPPPLESTYHALTSDPPVGFASAMGLPSGSS